jgi:hypothetical protein
MATDAERAALVLRIRTLSGGSKSELADHIEADGIELARLAAENAALHESVDALIDHHEALKAALLDCASWLSHDCPVTIRERASGRLAVGKP